MSSSSMRSRLLQKGKRVNTWQMKPSRDKVPRPEHLIKKWTICRGDTVEVTRGKDAGKQGVVRKVLRRSNKVIVRGVNLVKKPIPAQAARNQPGAIPGDLLTVEAPLPYSVVALVDPTTNQPCKVFLRLTDDGQRVRVSRASGAVVEKAPFITSRLARVRPTDTVLDTPPDVVGVASFSASSLLPWPKGVPPPGWKNRIAVANETTPLPARTHPTLRQIKAQKDARKKAAADADAAGLASQAAAAEVFAKAQQNNEQRDVFAEGTKEQTERYAPLSARSSKSSTNPSNGVDSNDRIAKRPRKPAADDDDDESTAASTTEVSSISGGVAMSDVAGMLEDDEHMRSSYRLREVASWLRLPYDEQRKPKRHTTARAHDTTRFGGELWLLRVPADLDLNLLNGASFVDADLDGETEIQLAPDVARSAVQIDQDGAASTHLVLSARPQEVTQAFKCAFPSVLRVRDAVDDGDDNDGGDAAAAAGNVRTINHLKFGAAFDRAFTVHRWSAPVSQTTTLNPVYDDAFLDNRARVQPVEASALKHKFLPIGASTATTTAVVAERDSRRTKESSSSAAEKEKKKERKKEKKQHRESEESHKSKKSTSTSSSKHKK